jgi:hypothetical protein
MSCIKYTEFFASVLNLFYFADMPSKPASPRAPNSLSFRIGAWIEASATGWGLAVLVALAILLAVVIVVRWPDLLPP